MKDRTRKAQCLAALLAAMQAALAVLAGTCLRSTPNMTCDFEDDTYSVPLGLGIGHVWKRGTTTCNLFAEPQWPVADEGSGWPEWHAFAGLNLIFE